MGYATKLASNGTDLASNETDLASDETDSYGKFQRPSQ